MYSVSLAFKTPKLHYSSALHLSLLRGDVLRDCSVKIGNGRHSATRETNQILQRLLFRPQRTTQATTSASGRRGRGRRRMDGILRRSSSHNSHHRNQDGSRLCIPYAATCRSAANKRHWAGDVQDSSALSGPEINGGGSGSLTNG